MRQLVLPVLLSGSLLPALVSAQSAPTQPLRGGRHSHRGRVGTVSGHVALADGQSPDQVSVMVKGTAHGTTPDAAGNFSLEAPTGWQVITVSSLGYSAQETTVEVQNGQTVTMPDLTLVRGNRQLDEVTVTGNKTLNQRPTAVGKMPVAPLDLPQAAITVGQQVLEEQQVLRLSDAVVNTPGLYVMGATGGTQEELASRGFAYTSNNTFKNGVRYNNSIFPEASSLEKLEVLKGSAAILYGNVAAGGVLNLVTKKPRFERGGSVGLRLGSFGFVKPTFDVYGAVGQSDKVAFRLNGTYERGDSYRDEVKGNRVYVNPSLLFRLTPKTDLLVEGDFLRDRRTPDFGIGAINYQIIDSRSRFLNVPGALNSTNQTSATATLTSRLNDTWSIRAIGGFQRYENELKSGARPTNVIGTAGATYGNWTRTLQRTETAQNYFLAELDLTGQFRTGTIGHTLLVGADADQYQGSTLAYTNPAAPGSTTTAVSAYDVINILDRSRVLTQPTLRLGGFDDLVAASITKDNTRRAGIYAQDLVSLGDKVKVLAGVRWSYQETPSDVYTYSTVASRANNTAGTYVENRRYDNAFSPRFGVVYQPVKNSAIFASYSNSFSPNTGIATTGAALPPSIIDQVEVGVKNDLFHGALSVNATAYRIVNSNQAQTVQQYIGGTVLNPNYNAAFPNAQELAGEVTSKGVEVDVQSKPYLGWSVLAGYSYNNTAYTNSNLYENGSRLRYAPAHTVNASLFYNFNSAFEAGFLRGLSLGVVGYYVGDRLAGRNPRLQYDRQGNLLTDTFQYIALPNYFQFDANIGYTYQRFTLRAKAANLLGKLSYNVHDDNSVNPIAPRNYAATLSFQL
jgi:iron complex outermembrane receptor protein